MKVFECIPNLSEGRDPGLIRELRDAAAETGTTVAHCTSDRDHNRTVMTWFGTADQIQAACSACLDVIVPRRSLAEHRGVHPRTGLLDVVPWVALECFDSVPATDPRRSTFDETAAGACDCARTLAARHEIPAFLYEACASGPHRADLASHRRALGGTGALASGPAASGSAASGPGVSEQGAPARAEGGASPRRTVPCRTVPPAWPADFGPSQFHPRAGALMVGARRPLIAFNFDLDGDDLRLARRIAGRIRMGSPGGLPGVKSLGLVLPERGCVQVSVNLVDARATDLPTLAERVLAEAERLGGRVRSGELIGLATADALGSAGAADLFLEELPPECVVETHLRRLGLLDGEPPG